MAGEKIIRTATNLQKTIFDLKKKVRSLDDTISSNERNFLELDILKSVLASMEHVRASLFMLTALSGESFTLIQKNEIGRMDQDISAYKISITLIENLLKLGEDKNGRN